MNERTAAALATLGTCSPEEKDLILSELLSDKWRREGEESAFFVGRNGSPHVGFCLVVDPAIPSTMPPLTESDWAEIQNEIKHLDDALTTEEAKDFLRQAVARRFAQL